MIWISTFTLSGMSPLAYQHRLPVSLLIPMIFGRTFLAKTIMQNTKLRGSSLIECLFYTNLDSLSSFKWTGPDPLSNSTQASDIFLHMSALLFPKDVYWIEFRFVRFDRASGETIGEDLFFLPRVETALGNLCRIRRQLLDTITWHAVRATCTSFRLSLWPRMESLLYSSHSTQSSLTAPDAIPGPTVLCA
jgi:hypothetical protein